jgi:hypothetical protein
MQDLTSLNELYADYRQGNLDRRDLEGKMFRIILENIQNFHLFYGDKEESVDYLCWLYPRFSKAVQNYQNNGTAFSTYIGALVRYSIREYRTRQIDHYITEYAAWTARAADMEVRSPAVEYPERIEEEGENSYRAIPLPRLNSRQVLMLILKSYYFVSEDLAERAAPFAGVESEKLKEMIEKLRVRRSKKEEALRLSQERITTQFYRCITWEKRLKTLLPGSVRHVKVQVQLERARKRLGGMRKRIATLRMDATHGQIAEVLGVSKGSVSSTFFKIKPYCEHYYARKQLAAAGGDTAGDRGLSY